MSNDGSVSGGVVPAAAAEHGGGGLIASPAFATSLKARPDAASAAFLDEERSKKKKGNKHDNSNRQVRDDGEERNRKATTNPVPPSPPPQQQQQEQQKQRSRRASPNATGNSSNNNDDNRPNVAAADDYGRRRHPPPTATTAAVQDATAPPTFFTPPNRRRPDAGRSSSSNNNSGAVPTPSSFLALSPSRTISESLLALARSTGQQLEEVWDEVGYSPEDRASQISDLLRKFQSICEEKVAEERGVAATFRETIKEAQDEIRRTSKALKTTVDPNLLFEANTASASDGGNNRGNEAPYPTTLTDQLATLEAALEGLRTTADAAKEDLRTCRDYLVEVHDALGLEIDPTWFDIESDLTLRRQQEFQRKRSEMKKELASRTAAVIQLVKDCQQLVKDLRMDPKSFSDLDRRIASSLVRSEGDHGPYIMASKFRSETCVGISASSVEELTKRVAELHGEKRRRKLKLQEMGAEIAVLWEKLHVPEEDQLAFTQSVQGLGTDTIEKGEIELQRLHRLKSDMLGNLIVEAREKISSLWDQINMPVGQRRSFDSFYSVSDQSLFTDQLLDEHEACIRLLTERLEKMKPILKMIERREEIIRERMEYEELQKDPERLKQRGAALTKQLMEEEKMARRIKKELPRLTDLLMQKLVEWKEDPDNNNRDFEYNGQVYLQLMDRQEEEWQQYKEIEMQRKLKKKQREQTFADHRFPSTKFGGTKNKNAPVAGGIDGGGAGASHQRTLGDARSRANSRPPNHAGRNHSHDVGKAAAGESEAPLRGLGTKPQSTRF